MHQAMESVALLLQDGQPIVFVSQALTGDPEEIF